MNRRTDRGLRLLTCAVRRYDPIPKDEGVLCTEAQVDAVWRRVRRVAACQPRYKHTVRTDAPR